MNLGDSLILSIVDKLVLGVLLAGVGYWLNRKLEHFKSELGLRQSISRDRADSYRALWKLTQEIGGTGVKKPIEEPDRKSFSKKLHIWYWDDGNALYMSHSATTLLMKCWPMLDSGTDSDVRNHLSALRTQLKIDCGVYTENEARGQVMPE